MLFLRISERKPQKRSFKASHHLRTDSFRQEHQIPLLNTAGDFLTVVSIDGSKSRLSPDFQPPDVFVPKSSAGNVLVIPKGVSEIGPHSQSKSPSFQHNSSGRCVSAPLMRSHSTLPCSSHSSPAVLSSKPLISDACGASANSAVHISPIAIQHTADSRAAVATVLLKVPGQSRHSGSIYLGSALVTTRHLALTLPRDGASGRRRNFFTSKFL